jgi:hypothetical protein
VLHIKSDRDLVSRSFRVLASGFFVPGEKMNTRCVRSASLLMLLIASLFVAVRETAAQEEDPPSRVARLGYIKGQVSFDPAGTDDWVSAVVNRPITTGDKLWTDGESRAELHIGSAAIRLSERTGFSFLNLSDRMMQIRLTEGTIGIRVRRLADDEAIEVDTPNLAFSILRPGRYRLNVNEAGDTTIINVTDGEGEVTGGGSSYSVHPGQQGIFTGTDSVDGDIERLPDADSFDQWGDQRDLREDHAVARRYVSDDVIGYEDLDDYGGWRPTPEYGTVWFPHVTVVGWAPYRYGHWAFVAPWGWTWVDDSPWGFAPFHYGRWIFASGAWGWVPCPPRVVAVAYVRPVYAPALVAWVGGPHFAVGIGVGGGFAAGVNVGWFPLGPREVFVPSYPVSRTYVNNVNVSNTNVNTTVVNNYYNTTTVNKNVTVNNNVTNVHYMNQGVNGAVTATSPQTFTSAQPVGRNMVAVNQREVASAPVATAAPAVVPPKQAVLGGGAATSVHPPVALQTRAVVAKAAPPPAPLPFQQHQAAIQANQGRPIAMAQARQLEAAHARTTTVAAVTPVKIAPAAKPATPKMNAMQNNPSTKATNPNRPVVTSGVPQNPNAVPNKGPSPQAAMNRPPSARPTAVANPQLEQKHQQQNEQLQQKQDQERQKLERQQYQQQQKLQQQNANEQRQKQIQEQQQQKLTQLEQKHGQQAQALQQKQESEHAHSAPPAKTAKQDEQKHH